MKKIILVIFLLLVGKNAYPEVMDLGSYLDYIATDTTTQGGSQAFQEKRSVVLPGAGSTYKLGKYKLTTLIGEVLGGAATNSAHFIHSSGYLSGPQAAPGFDTTAPTMPVVIDDGVYTTSQTTLRFKWSARDSESGIGEYLYSVPGLIGWTSAGLRREIILTNLQLQHGQTYYCKVKAINNSGLTSQEGTSNGIMVNFSIPTITSLVPENLKKVYDNTAIAVTATASDNDGDVLEYEFIIDGQTKQNWTKESTFSWIILASDVGKTHLIKVNVRDGKGAVASKQSKIFILHKPINPPVH